MAESVFYFVLEFYFARTCCCRLWKQQDHRLELRVWLSSHHLANSNSVPFSSTLFTEVQTLHDLSRPPSQLFVEEVQFDLDILTRSHFDVRWEPHTIVLTKALIGGELQSSAGPSTTFEHEVVEVDYRLVCVEKQLRHLTCNRQKRFL